MFHSSVRSRFEHKFFQPAVDSLVFARVPTGMSVFPRGEKKSQPPNSSCEDLLHWQERSLPRETADREKVKRDLPHNRATNRNRRLFPCLPAARFPAGSWQ